MNMRSNDEYSLECTNPTFQPILYAGGLYDFDTKLYRFGARDYDPTIGRWTTKDPSGFAGGDTNLYAYVGGNPMSFYDPEGEFAIPLIIPFIPAIVEASIVITSAVTTGWSINELINWYNQRKGERKTTAKESGTPNPYKHLRPHPTDPNKVIKKDPHSGRWDPKPKPPGFDDWWNGKKPCP